MYFAWAQAKYKEQYEKNKHVMSQLEETREMKISKELRPIQSKKMYAEKSKEMQKTVTVGAGGTLLVSQVLL